MKEKRSNIYKITNKINGKIYIGQSKFKNDKYFGSGKKIKEDLKKYGIDNFEKEYLLFCEEKDLDKNERRFIKYNNSCDENIGYNINSGGSGTPLGDKNPTSKEVFVYDFDGNLIESFIGVKEKARELKINPSIIAKVARREKFSFRDKIFLYEKKQKDDIVNEVNNYRIYKQKKIDEKKNKIDIYFKNIKTGEVFVEKSITEISKKTGSSRSDIRKCLKKIRNHSNGFMFKYKEDDWIDLDKVREKRDYKNKTYIAIDYLNNVYEFTNISDFCDKNNLERRKVNSIILKEFKNTKIEGWKDFYVKENK